MKKFVLALGVLAWMSTGFSQTSNFEVVSNNKVIGTITTEKKVDGKNTSYAYTSKIDYNIGVELKTEESLQTTYRSDTMVSNTTQTKINAKSRFNIQHKIDEKTNTYNRTVNTKQQTVNIGIIKYAYINLFFNAPPDNLRQVFSEIYGKTLVLTKESTGVYVITDPMGRKSTFYYEDGRFQKATITNSLGVYFIKKKG